MTAKFACLDKWTGEVDKKDAGEEVKLIISSAISPPLLHLFQVNNPQKKSLWELAGQNDPAILD